MNDVKLGPTLENRIKKNFAINKDYLYGTLSQAVIKMKEMIRKANDESAPRSYIFYRKDEEGKITVHKSQKIFKP